VSTSNRILLRFRVLLSDDVSDNPIEPIGPLFHRWLPDGENDAIEIPTGESGVTLHVWFERCGVTMPGGFVHFHYQKREVDPVIVRRQSPLSGGPLRGRFEFAAVSQEVMMPLRSKSTEDAAYQAFGKHVVCNLLHPLVSRFIVTLRTNFGQFWLPELDRWDSRTRSLGAYCSDLRLMWSDDDGMTWSTFEPNEPSYVIRGRPGTPSEFLTQSSWQELGDFVRSGYAPSTAALLIGRAHAILEAGDLRYAVVEAVAALEVALSDALRAPNTPKSVTQNATAFSENLPITAQLAAAAALLGGFEEEQITRAFKALKLRHRVVHEGETPNGNALADIRALLQVAARFVGGPKFRFPTIPTGRHLFAESDPTT
jgi:hypothetical protein